MMLSLSLLEVSCGSSRQANSTARADNQVYTRREWEARQRTGGNNPGSISNNTDTGLPNGTTLPEDPIAEDSGERTAGTRSTKASKVITTAKSYLGTPYVYGGTSRKGLDCSALMQHAFRTVAIELPRTSRDQGKVGTPISRKAIQPGDLLFFYASTAGVVGHAGLVVEASDADIKFIHASLSGGVRMDFLSNRHWTAHFLYARRVLK
jgi:probable lipoprotein NlpC